MPRYVAGSLPLIIAYRLDSGGAVGLPGAGSRWHEQLFNIFFIVLGDPHRARGHARRPRHLERTLPTYRDKPLNSYVQVASMVLYFIAAILIFSLLTGRSALAFLTAMGAASAVLLLIFKDAILGFVASIQISTQRYGAPRRLDHHAEVRGRWRCGRDQPHHGEGHQLRQDHHHDPDLRARSPTPSRTGGGCRRAADGGSSAAS